MQIERFITAKQAAGRSPRTIQFYRSELAAAALWMQANGHDLDHADAGATPDLLAYLFNRPAHHAPELWTGNDGSGGARGALTDNGIRQMLRRRSKAAGMRPINPHSLRHGFAMEMLNNGGASLEAVSKFLGHASPEITRRFYADYIDEELAAIYTAAIDRSARRRVR